MNDSIFAVELPFVDSDEELEKIKNIDLIIRGFSLYKSSRPKSRLNLAIVGEGIERGNLQRLASNLGVENSVIFLGRLKPADLAQVA